VPDVDEALVAARGPAHEGAGLQGQEPEVLGIVVEFHADYHHVGDSVGLDLDVEHAVVGCPRVVREDLFQQHLVVLLALFGRGLGQRHRAFGFRPLDRDPQRPVPHLDEHGQVFEVDRTVVGRYQERHGACGRPYVVGEILVVVGVDQGCEVGAVDGSVAAVVAHVVLDGERRGSAHGTGVEVAWDQLHRDVGVLTVGEVIKAPPRALPGVVLGGDIGDIFEDRHLAPRSTTVGGITGRHAQVVTLGIAQHVVECDVAVLVAARGTHRYRRYSVVVEVETDLVTETGVGIVRREAEPLVGQVGAGQVGR